MHDELQLSRRSHQHSESRCVLWQARETLQPHNARFMLLPGKQRMRRRECMQHSAELPLQICKSVNLETASRAAAHVVSQSSASTALNCWNKWCGVGTRARAASTAPHTCMQRQKFVQSSMLHVHRQHAHACRHAYLSARCS